MNMTTEIEVATGLELPGKFGSRSSIYAKNFEPNNELTNDWTEQKTHCFFVFNVISEPSPLIDFDELIFDNNKVLGDGAYGTVYRGRVSAKQQIVILLLVWMAPILMIYISIVAKMSPLRC